MANLGVEHGYLDPSPFNEAGAGYFVYGAPGALQSLLVMVRACAWHVGANCEEGGTPPELAHLQHVDANGHCNPPQAAQGAGDAAHYELLAWFCFGLGCVSNQGGAVGLHSLERVGHSPEPLGAHTEVGGPC